MATLEIRQFMCRSDNFGVLLHERASGATAAIDAPDEAAVRAELRHAGLKLTHIFTTHHHYDHVGGHDGLKRETGCVIYGAASDEGRIPGLDIKLKDGDVFKFGSFEVRVLATPGHTLGAITYYIPHAEQMAVIGEKAGVAFTGDTLFSVGCGRVMEGTHAMMWASLQKIAALPPQTLIYCGHEYTQANIAFALSVEQGNEALLERKREVDLERGQDRPTLPVTLGRELQTNPFLRPHSAEIRGHLGMEKASDEEVFAELRRRKDRF